ncbi:hypothetical protein DEO72_LG1g3330 [Vigna unguiculata]|uniref:Uncharacterized protein n=1 Tax=Vigna unguiculata TaxID=3917 RepID=A0A4D6KSZ8_VIGUN|nr:hypothetical protein DEO72_LG1g3330 [Vigna unguiculata]
MGGFSRTRLDEPSLALASPFLAQRCEVPRLGYNCSNTPRAPMRSRLDEHVSPKRDSTSLKTKTLRLSESSSASWGLFSASLA